MIQEKATPTDNANAYLRGLTNYCAKRCCFEAKLPYEYSAFVTGLIFYIEYKNVNKYKKRQNKRVRTQCVRTQLVPVAGVEPARYRYHWILSPARLPIPSHRQVHCILATKVLYTKLEICQPLKAYSVINFYINLINVARLGIFPSFQMIKCFRLLFLQCC